MELVWQFLLQNGVSGAEIELIKHSYILIVMIPIVSTILAILRYIIGIKGVSIYAAIVLTFAFIELGSFGGTEDFWLGLKYGTLLYFIVFITSTLVYGLIKKWRMHYVPKMSLIFIAVSFAYILLIIASRLTDRASLLVSSTFVLIIIATLAESITTSYARKNLKYAIDLGLRVYLISLFCFVIVTLTSFRNITLDYPYIVIIIIALNIYIGRFKGLRLNEYWRFRSILFSKSTEDEHQSDNKK